LKLLADISKKYIKWNSDKTVSFVCNDNPNEGPDDLIFEMKMSESEIRNKILEGFVTKGEENGMKGIFDKCDIHLKSFLCRKKLDWWIFDLHQLSSVPKYNKNRFLGFLSKNIPKLLLPHQNATQVQEKYKGKDKRAEFDQFIKKIATEGRDQIEEFIKHVDHL